VLGVMRTGLQGRRERDDLKDGAGSYAWENARLLIVCWTPATPTFLPHVEIGPRTPAVVLVLTSDASARISPVFTSHHHRQARQSVGAESSPAKSALGDVLQ